MEGKRTFIFSPLAVLMFLLLLSSINGKIIYRLCVCEWVCGGWVLAQLLIWLEVCTSPPRFKCVTMLCVGLCVCASISVCVVTSNIDSFCDETPSHLPLHHHSGRAGQGKRVCTSEITLCVWTFTAVIEWMRLLAEKQLQESQKTLNAFQLLQVNRKCVLLLQKLLCVCVICEGGS